MNTLLDLRTSPVRGLATLGWWRTRKPAADVPVRGFADSALANPRTPVCNEMRANLIPGSRRRFGLAGEG
jgi:hypothetical protein